MKKIIYILLFIILISCSKHKEVEEENIPIIAGNTIENDIDNEKIDQIKNLLKDKQNMDTLTKTGTQNNIQKNEVPINNVIKSKTTESSILTKEELNIIENTTDGEIDKLINLLFKDLN